MISPGLTSLAPPPHITGMDLKQGDKLDSRCGLCERDNRTGPETMAVDWVERGSGTRLYVCADHARPLGRFGTALEDMAATPHADTCTTCGTLTRIEDMAGPRVCAECGDREIEEVVRANAGAGMSFEESMALAEDLMDEDEDVDPERAAEAVERLTGMPMVPAAEVSAEGIEDAEGEGGGGEAGGD